MTAYANSLAGQVASIFLGLGVLVAAVSWFQMRLEENERLEKLEVEELARTPGRPRCLKRRKRRFSRRNASREQFERFFVPGFTVLLFLLEAGGAWLLWRWMSQTHRRHCARPRDAGAGVVRHFRAGAVPARPVLRHHCAAGKPPAAAARRELSAGRRLCLCL